MEIRTLFKELVGRLDTVELTAQPTFVQSRLVSGPKTLPVRYTWR
jgi:cytochrome P450